MRLSASAAAVLLCLLLDAVVRFAAPSCHAGMASQPSGVASPSPIAASARMPCHGMAADESPAGPLIVRAAQRDCCAGHLQCGIASSTAVPLPHVDRADSLPDAAEAVRFAERSRALLVARPLDHVPLA